MCRWMERRAMLQARLSKRAPGPQHLTRRKIRNLKWTSCFAGQFPRPIQCRQLQRLEQDKNFFLYPHGLEIQKTRNRNASNAHIAALQSMSGCRHMLGSKFTERIYVVELT